MFFVTIEVYHFAYGNKQIPFSYEKFTFSKLLLLLWVLFIAYTIEFHFLKLYIVQISSDLKNKWEYNRKLSLIIVKSSRLIDIRIYNKCF